MADNIVPMAHSARIQAAAAAGQACIKSAWYVPCAGHCQVCQCQLSTPLNPNPSGVSNPLNPSPLNPNPNLKS